MDMLQTKEDKMEINIFRATSIVGAAFFLAGLSGCSSPSEKSPEAPQPQVFQDEDTSEYSMSFSSTFPTDASEATAVASDASGKGPFTANIACTSGDSMSVTIDGEENHKISCDGTKTKIDGIQKVAKTGGVKFTISSPKQDGSWKIQLMGSRD